MNDCLKVFGQRTYLRSFIIHSQLLTVSQSLSRAAADCSAAATPAISQAAVMDLWWKLAKLPPQPSHSAPLPAGLVLSRKLFQSTYGKV